MSTYELEFSLNALDGEEDTESEGEEEELDEEGLPEVAGDEAI